MNIPNCCVGTTLHENCHQMKYTRKQGLKILTDLENDAIHLLQMRTNHIFPPETSTICLHHEQVYITIIPISTVRVAYCEPPWDQKSCS